MKKILLIATMLFQGLSGDETNNFDFLLNESTSVSVEKDSCSQVGELAGAMAMLKIVSREVNKDKEESEISDARMLAFVLNEQSTKLGINSDDSLKMAQNIWDYDIVNDMAYESLSYGYYYKIKCELEKEGKKIAPLSMIYKDLHQCWLIESQTGVLAQDCFREVLTSLDKNGTVKKNIQLLIDGKEKLLEKKAQLSIDNYFNPIIEACNDKKSKVDISICGDAFYHKGSAYIELEQYDEAKRWIERAISTLPKDAIFLTELGYIYQIKKLPLKALELYKRAQDIALKSPEYQDNQQGLSRAIRGEGFVLTDMGRLDEAEASYKRALKLNPKDEKAKYELEYIKQLRARKYDTK